MCSPITEILLPRVVSTELPHQSDLHEFVGEGDFLDCYAIPSDRTVREAAEIATAFPWWVRALMTLRNLVVRPFGLSTEGPEATDKIGIFPIRSETETELVAGFNDRHLDFRIAILSHDEQIHFATWVHPHNVGGRIYLGLVLPFHIIIIRHALGRLSRV